MKRWKKIVLFVAALILIPAVILCAWQWDNLKALHSAMTKDEATILREMEQIRQKLESDLTDHKIGVTAPTTEQIQSLLNGSASADEIKEQLGLTGAQQNSVQTSGSQQVQTVETPPSDGESPSQTPTQTPIQTPAQTESAQAKADELVNSCISELYACQVDIMASLGAMKQEALDQWNSLSESERTPDKLREIGLNGLTQCYHMEVEADKQVKDILARYRTQLETLGADTAILDTMWTYYCNEKASQKAYYLNKYM